MAFDSKLYPDAEEQESTRADVREESSRDQPSRDDSSMKQEVTPPGVTGGIISTEVTDFSVPGYKVGKNVCPSCGTRVPALLAKEGRNPGKGFKREFACTQCADFGVSDNPAFMGMR